MGIVYLHSLFHHGKQAVIQSTTCLAAIYFMRVTLISYKKVFYTGIIYLPEHIGCEVEVNEGEDAMEAIKYAHDLVVEGFNQLYKGTPYADQGNPEPEVLPVIRYD